MKTSIEDIFPELIRDKVKREEMLAAHLKRRKKLQVIICIAVLFYAAMEVWVWYSTGKEPYELLSGNTIILATIGFIIWDLMHVTYEAKILQTIKYLDDKGEDEQEGRPPV